MDAPSTRTRILARAEDLLDESGLEGFSLREVARRVGITPMAVYRHFTDKEALLEELFVRGFVRLDDTLQAALKGATAADRLRETFRRYLLFATESPHTYELVFERRMRRSDRPGRMTVPAFRFVVDRVRDCVEVGALSPGDPEAVALDLWALTHGLVTLRRVGKLELDPERFASYFEGMIERQLRPRPADQHT